MTEWWKPDTSGKIPDKPWISQKATEKLESIVSLESDVIEFGAGGSTIWFADRCKSVLSHEDKLDWYEKLLAVKPDNAELVWTLALPDTDKEFDIVFIDGEPVHKRTDWLRIAHLLVKTGGWVVLDNANRPEYVRERKALQDACEFYETIDGNEKGTRYLVTEFYKMKGNTDAEDRPKPKKTRTGGRKNRKAGSNRGDTSPEPTGVSLPENESDSGVLEHDAFAGWS